MVGSSSTPSKFVIRVALNCKLSGLSLIGSIDVAFKKDSNNTIIIAIDMNQCFWEINIDETLLLSASAIVVIATMLS